MGKAPKPTNWNPFKKSKKQQQQQHAERMVDQPSPMSPDSPPVTSDTSPQSLGGVRIDVVNEDTVPFVSSRTPAQLPASFRNRAKELMRASHQDDYDSDDVAVA
mmetsp:Transcript_47911/g.112648  ORF Transcript_47911/g.112648 Transcript_47911/m.112648 type:complete len:104 (-) Transcript_47911:45-356(-)